MGDCDVCIGGDYDCDGYPEFYRATEPKARRDHKCLECNSTIRRGERYDRRDYKYDNVMQVDKTCLPCAEIRGAYSCGNAEPIGELWEQMREYGFDHLKMAGECWDSLSAPAKAKLLEKWRAWKGITV